MKKNKSLIAFLIILSIIFTPIVPLAAETIVINGGADLVTADPDRAGNWTKYPGSVTFSHDYKMIYNFNAPKAGTYHLSIVAGSDSGAVARIAIGEASMTAMFDTGANSKTIEKYLGIVNVSKGDNKIIVSQDTRTMLGLSKIILEKTPDGVQTDFRRKEGAYKNNFLPTLIEAEDFDMGSDACGSSRGMMLNNTYREPAPIEINSSDDGNIVKLYKDDWSKYTFNVTADSSYDFSIKSASAGIVHLYFDKEVNPIIAVLSEGGESYVDNIFLKKGTHTLKVVSTERVVDIDSLVFRGSTVVGKIPSEIGVDLNQAEIKEQEAKKSARPVWKNIYVSASANKSGDGSKANPFVTIEEAKEYVSTISSDMQGDIVVNILPGEYFISEKLNFGVEDGGKNGHHIIYRGTNALDKPLIHGGKHVTGWKDAGNGVWKTKLTGVDVVRQLYINGYPAQRARSNYKYRFGANYDIPDNEYAVDGWTANKINFPVIKENPEDLEIMCPVLWTMQRIPVTDIIDNPENNEWIYVFNQPGASWVLTYQNTNVTPKVGVECYLENAYELLNEQGEYYFNSKTKELFYIPYPEEDMTKADAVIPVTEFLMDIRGNSKTDRVENISFDNLDIRYGAWNGVENRGFCTKQADIIVPEVLNWPQGTNGAVAYAQIDVNCAKGMEFTNCNFQNLGCGVINFTDHVEDAAVKGCVFRDTAGHAVTVGAVDYPQQKEIITKPSDLSRGIEITNNVVRRIGLDYHGSTAFSVYYANDVTINHNDIKDTPYTMVSAGWGWAYMYFPRDFDAGDYDISFNKMVNTSLSVRDGGHIYCLGEMGSGINIEGNHMVFSEDYGGVYPDSGSSHLRIHNNVFEECTYANICFGANPHNLDNKAWNNWADRPCKNKKVWDTAGTGSSREDVIVVEDGNWPAEAVAVMEEAGVEAPYDRLLSGVELPSWRRFTLGDSRKDFYTEKRSVFKWGADYIPGGEGVGFHEITSDIPTDYGKGQNIGNTTAGEWLCYEIDMIEGGTYDFNLNYSLAFDGTESNATSNSGLNLYVDGNKVIDGYMLEPTGSWSARIDKLFENVLELTPGKHIIKVEFVKGGFSFTSFTIRKHGQTTSEPEYDDAIPLVIQKGE